MRHRRRDLLWRSRLRWGDQYGKRATRIQPDPACPELAIGAVAMGEKYADWCLTMLTSLRERGAYRGPVYVITDLPELFEPLKNVVVVCVPSTRHRLIAKGCKQVLMHYVSEPVFLYLDSDLVVTSPIVDWYRDMQPALKRAPVLCYEDVKPVEGAYHGGVVLVDMVRGRAITERWERAVRSGRWGSDQACLYSVAGSDGPAHFPSTGFMFLRELLAEGDGDDVECIVHVTNGVIRAHHREEIESYLRERLGVSRLPRIFD
tara:strand:+ start:2865 stop:3647 length:783 start_codon:yes stop_codon:yes gene_type:complete